MRRLLPVAVLALLPMVAFGGFRVSSVKKDSRSSTNTWSAASALDGDGATAWMIDPEQSNEGSWIEIDIPKSTLQSLQVVVGWDKDEKSFRDYARAKSLKVEVFDEGKGDERVLEHTVGLEDVRGWQSVALPETSVGNEVFGGKVRLTVQEVYPGTDFPNLAMSEVLLLLKEMPAPAKLKEGAPGASANGAELAVDGNAKTFWRSEADGHGAQFTVVADGFGVSSVGVQAGPTGFARPKTIEVIANEVVRTYTMADSQEMQWFLVAPIVGYTGSGWNEATVKIVDTYEGKAPHAAIAEIALRATNYGGL